MAIIRTIVINAEGPQGGVGPQGPQGPPGINTELDPVFVALSGSLATTGSNVFIGNQTVTGSLFTSGSNTLIGSTTLTGSFNVSGSTLQSGNNTLIGNTILSGSILVSGSSHFNNSVFVVTGSTSVLGNFNVRGASVFSNTTFTVTGSQYFTGSSFINGNQSLTGNSQITGSLNVIGNVNVVSGSSFTRWGNKLFNYGAFSDTTSQSGSANTAYTMRFNTVDIGESGVHIISQSRISVDNTGIYNLQFSAQLDRIAGSGNAFVSIWLRVTGSDIANSCTDVELTGNAAASATVAAWNFIFPLSANQYCELAWSTTDENIQLVAVGTRTNPIRPAVPSIIATLTQVA
jgi:hypothetical protein